MCLLCTVNNARLRNAPSFPPRYYISLLPHCCLIANQCHFHNTRKPTPLSAASSVRNPLCAGFHGWLNLAAGHADEVLCWMQIQWQAISFSTPKTRLGVCTLLLRTVDVTTGHKRGDADNLTKSNVCASKQIEQSCRCSNHLKTRCIPIEALLICHHMLKHHSLKPHR